MVFACLSTLLLAAVLVPATPARAAYDSTYGKDSYGNKVTIVTRINKYSYSEVEVKAYAKLWGGSFGGWSIGYPVFHGDNLRVEIYGYTKSGSRWNQVYGKYYYSGSNWTGTKTVRWTKIPRGLDKVKVRVRARYSSLIYGGSTIYKTMYSYY